MQQVRKIVIVARGSEEGALEMAIEEAMRRIEAGNWSGGDHNESSGFYFDVTDQVPDDELPVGGEPTDANEEGVSVQDITAELRQIGLSIQSGGGCEAWHLSVSEHFIYITNEDGGKARELKAGQKLVLGYYRNGQDHCDPVARVEGSWAQIKPLVQAFQSGQWAESNSLSASFESVIKGAADAFWAAIVAAYPMVKTGDFPPEATMAFDDACKRAAMTWLDGNLSAGAVILTEDGYRLERQEDGTYTAGDLTYGALESMEVDFVVQQGQ